jgi:hypothetical protein
MLLRENATARTAAGPGGEQHDLLAGGINSESTVQDRFQPMPPLTDEEYDALRSDIAEHGVRVPVVRDQHGRLLDGNNRARIAADLGIGCPSVVVQVKDDDEAETIAVTLNCARRHLNREQRRAVIRREIDRHPGESDRAIARRVGCSPSTVSAVRAGKVSNLDTPTGQSPWQTPADVDPEQRAHVLRVYDRLNLPADLPTSDADAEWVDQAILEDADRTLWLTGAITLGAGTAELAGAVISKMALWKSVGANRQRIHLLFDPWIDIVLSESKRAEITATNLFPISPDARVGLCDTCLDFVASIPKSPGGAR